MSGMLLRSKESTIADRFADVRGREHADREGGVQVPVADSTGIADAMRDPGSDGSQREGLERGLISVVEDVVLMFAWPHTAHEFFLGATRERGTPVPAVEEG